jgi:response regulator RpfG family c-di-GMP phosphodiesterase
VDYITKPISPSIVLARVRTHLTLSSAAAFLKDQKQYLEAEVQRRTREVQIVQDVTIMAMASLAETRDNETGNHIRRTQNYVRALAEKLRASAVRPIFRGQQRGDAAEVRAAARYRQGRHSGQHPAQARQAHRRRVRDHENASHARA